MRVRVRVQEWVAQVDGVTPCGVTPSTCVDTRDSQHPLPRCRSRSSWRPAPR